LTATKVSATAAKQQQEHNDNQDQFHWKPPLAVLAYFSRTASFDPPTAFCILSAALSARHLWPTLPA
jgi:hypothetical protein